MGVVKASLESPRSGSFAALRMTSILGARSKWIRGKQKRDAADGKRQGWPGGCPFCFLAGRIVGDFLFLEQGD